MIIQSFRLKFFDPLLTVELFHNLRTTQNDRVRSSSTKKESMKKGVAYVKECKLTY